LTNKKNHGVFVLRIKEMAYDYIYSKNIIKISNYDLLKKIECLKRSS